MTRKEIISQINDIENSIGVFPSSPVLKTENEIHISRSRFNGEELNKIINFIDNIDYEKHKARNDAEIERLQNLYQQLKSML